MKIPVRVYEPGQRMPEKLTIECKGGVEFNGAVRQFVEERLRAASPHKDADFEHVTVLFNGERRDMFVDEMGALQGLPVNDAATAIYWTASRARGESDFRNAPRIHGVAILFPDHQVWR